MNYTIISITAEYIEGFRAAVDSVARERKYLTFLEVPPLEKTIEYVAGNLRNGCPHFLAVSENKVIGWCDITSLDRHVFTHVGELGIGVIAQYRGHGVGTALIHTALAAAKTKGLERIELHVFETNKAAIALYEKFGFVIEGVKRNGVKIDDRYTNLICMGLLLYK